MKYFITLIVKYDVNATVMGEPEVQSTHVPEISLTESIIMSEVGAQSTRRVK